MESLLPSTLSIASLSSCIKGGKDDDGGEFSWHHRNVRSVLKQTENSKFFLFFCV